MESGYSNSFLVDRGCCTHSGVLVEERVGLTSMSLDNAFSISNSEDDGLGRAAPQSQRRLNERDARRKQFGLLPLSNNGRPAETDDLHHNSITTSPLPNILSCSSCLSKVTEEVVPFTPLDIDSAAAVLRPNQAREKRLAQLPSLSSAAGGPSNTTR
jgi:hypothetical protein